MFGKYAVFSAGSASRRTQFPKPRCKCQAAFNLQHWGSPNFCSWTPVQPFLQPDMKGMESPCSPNPDPPDTTSISLGPWDPYLIS